MYPMDCFHEERKANAKSTTFKLLPPIQTHQYSYEFKFEVEGLKLKVHLNAFSSKQRIYFQSKGGIVPTTTFP